MKKNFKKKLKINLVITLSISILSFISNKYFSEYMGAETLGLMRLFTQIIAYLNLADMGIGMASSYSLYKPLMEKNTTQINLIVSTIDYFYKRISIFILIVGLFLNIFLNKFIEESNYGYLLYIYWSLYVFNTSISYFYAKYSILFTANQEYERVRIIQGSGRIIFRSLQIILMIKTQSFFLFIIMMILENLYSYVLFNKHYRDNYSSIKKVKEIDKQIIKDSKNLFWHRLAGVIVFNTDYIVLSKFTSLTLIGIYSSYLIIYEMLMTLIGIITNVLAPTIGKFVAENGKKEIYAKWRELYLIYFYISTFMVICTYNLIIPFVKLWLGDKYILPSFTVILILINLFIQLTREITEIFKNVSGFFDDTYAPFLEGGLNLVFSLILVQKMGLNGVIIGTIISNVVVILVLKPTLVFKRCFNKRGRDYLKVFSFYSFLTITSIFFVQLIMMKIEFGNIRTWLDWITKAILISGSSIVIITVTFLIDRNFRQAVKKIIKL